MDTTAGAAAPHLLFIVTEDWFFASHFLPMARAARDGGFRVSVACRVRSHLAPIAAEGIRVLPVEADRGSLNPVSLLRAIRDLAALLRRERPDLVHLVALRSLLVGGCAARLVGVERRVAAVTGLGFLGAGATPWTRAARAITLKAVRAACDGPATVYLFENGSDPLLLGLDPSRDRRVAVVRGAGVDPEVFAPAPLPPVPPLRLAMVARMLWSKGVDTAVEAVRLARGRGHDVMLDLYGAPDPDNPRAIPEAQLRGWSAEPGIQWHGAVEPAAVPGIWAAHHAALLPSRGGEGLPRSLLEAAACGRAILTTDVPGCRDLVRDGVEGRLVPAGDVPALADALMELVAAPQRLAVWGEAARARVVAEATETAIGAAVLGLYHRLLAS